MAAKNADILALSHRRQVFPDIFDDPKGLQ